MSSYGKRFSGIGRLFGQTGLERLRKAHVCIIGVGGVGSWTVESLARSGIGELTLVDLDDVCISNVNRQLPALDGNLGKPKVDVLADRVRTINPECVVHPMQMFFTQSTAEQLLSAKYDYVTDAIDSLSLKALLIAMCHQLGLPILVTGGAGGRRDPTKIEISDLAFTSHCPLLQEVRRTLRRRHNFPRGDMAFGVEAVFSREAQVFPHADGSVCAEKPENPDLRLDCNSGFGTASFVTGAFGLAAAARVVQRLAEGPIPAPRRPSATDVALIS